ncbi:TIGR02301 family protein [Dichotomicrobium thermohalophilum]|nr:TIGR02301 family protein [Dichotomicrobium thermohalophilum]
MRTALSMMGQGNTRRVGLLASLMIGIVLIAGPVANAQEAGEAASQRKDSRPYDKELFQLAEVLGAVHYLRALCGADEGQKWRDQMRGLVDAEGASALRRAQLVRSFNKGYRGYGRTYRRCTDLARRSIERLMKEGRTLAKRILDTAG